MKIISRQQEYSVPSWFNHSHHNADLKNTKGSPLQLVYVLRVLNNFFFWKFVLSTFLFEKNAAFLQKEEAYFTSIVYILSLGVFLFSFVHILFKSVLVIKLRSCFKKTLLRYSIKILQKKFIVVYISRTFLWVSCIGGVYTEKIFVSIVFDIFIVMPLQNTLLWYTQEHKKF